MFLHLNNILINYLIHGFINVKTLDFHNIHSLVQKLLLSLLFNWFKKTTKNSIQGFCIASNIKYLDDKVEK